MEIEGVYMDKLKISQRLLKIAKFVPSGYRVADIGSDHALLPSYLVLYNDTSFVIAGEVNQGPYQAAKKQILNLHLEDSVSVRKGDGLSVIEASDEIDAITIAGMGGSLIAHILTDGKDKLKGIKRLILQPNVGSEMVRKWLDNNKWDIISEDILEEDNKIYEMIVAEPRKDETDPVYNQSDWTKEELYRLGPLLINEKSGIMLKKWRSELRKIEMILKQLNNANNEDEAETKRNNLLSEKKWLLEVLGCLQTDRI